eukprot:6191585-Pleurochrysis_carterae.AAC.1
MAPASMMLPLLCQLIAGASALSLETARATIASPFRHCRSANPLHRAAPPLLCVAEAPVTVDASELPESALKLSVKVTAEATQARTGVRALLCKQRAVAA